VSYSNRLRDSLDDITLNKGSWLDTFQHDTQDGTATAVVNVTSARLFQNGRVCLRLL